MAADLSYFQVDLTNTRILLDQENAHMLLAAISDSSTLGFTDLTDRAGEPLRIFHRHIESIAQITPASIAFEQRFARDVRAAVDRLDPEGSEEKPAKNDWE